MSRTFQRDQLTWTAYVMLAWFAYLQASPGLVVPHLRDELGLSYSVAGLHVAAFAAGALVAGLVSPRLEIAAGRRRLLWTAAALMAAGTIGLTAGHVVVATGGAVLVMGFGGGLVLATIQAVLADHHGAGRTVALAEANVAAAVSYVLLIGVFSLTAAMGVDWRVALLISLLVPGITWWVRRDLAIDTVAPEADEERVSLPAAFWVAAGVLMCVTTAEWCIGSWGATFVDEEVGVSTDTAVALMAGYFGGFLLGRTIGSRLARRHDPSQLLAVALGVAAAGFFVLWPAGAPAQAVVGLALLGLGIGNLFPMALAVAVSLVPGRAGPASGRAVALTSMAGLLAPVTVGALADATSLPLALGIVPALLALAGSGLVLAARAGKRSLVSS